MPSLVRYFSEANGLAFVARGEVLFRALSYFRDYEDNGVRADEHEGTLVHKPLGGLQANFVRTGAGVDLPHSMEATAKEDDIFVYCMSTELSPDIGERFNAEMAVEILDPGRFLGRVRNCLALRKRIYTKELVHGHVRYYEWHEPPIVDWALPERIVMRKPKSFEWQKEYRIAAPLGDAFRVQNVSVKLVAPGTPRPPRATAHPEMRLKLGSLSKICRVHML